MSECLCLKHTEFVGEEAERYASAHLVRRDVQPPPELDAGERFQCPCGPHLHRDWVLWYVDGQAHLQVLIARSYGVE